MPVNLLNESELNQFLTSSVCVCPVAEKFSATMMISPEYLQENVNSLAKVISAQWLKVKFRQEMGKNFDESYLEEVKNTDKNSPHWLAEALAQGKKVFRFVADKFPLQKLNELQTLCRFTEMVAKEYILSQLKQKNYQVRLDYLKTCDGFNSLEKVWNAYNRAKKEKLLSQGIQVVSQYDKGYQMVLLKTRESFSQEGNLMGHCVGYEDYFERYRQGEIKIYSLRDKNFKPHVTLEVQGNKILQARGRADQNIHIDYLPYVFNFIQENSLKVVPLEQANVGIIEKDNRYYNLFHLPQGCNFKLENLDVSDCGLKKLPQWKNLEIADCLDLSTSKITNLQGCAKAKKLRLYDCFNLNKDCLKDIPAEVEVLEDFGLGVEALQYLPSESHLRCVEFQYESQKHDLQFLKKIPLKFLEQIEFTNVSAEFLREREKIMLNMRNSCQLFRNKDLMKVG